MHSETNDTSFERFAAQYDAEMGDTGDYNHQKTIDPPLFDLIADPSGLKIYDIACGNGYIARKLKRKGAAEIWASDIAPTLIKFAQEKYPSDGIRYLVCEAEDFSDIPENHFDLVVIHMSIWYVADLDAFLGNVRRILKPLGRFIFSIDHPLKSSLYGALNIITAEDANSRNENYIEAKRVKVYNNWLKEESELSVYLRPMGYYINLCGKHQLFVRAIRESATDMLRNGKNLKSNIPMKMVIEAVKV